MSGALAFILVLISYIFYSFGAVLKAGKNVDLRPQIIDIVIIFLLWAGAISSALVLELNEWLLVAAWISLCVFMGILFTWLRKAQSKIELTSSPSVPAEGNIIKRLWHSWEAFTVRLGGFQTRIAFTLFFLIVMSPIAVAVRLRHDPLRLRLGKLETYWLPRSSILSGLDDLRKQF